MTATVRGEPDLSGDHASGDAAAARAPDECDTFISRGPGRLQAHRPALMCHTHHSARLRALLSAVRRVIDDLTTACYVAANSYLAQMRRSERNGTCSRRGYTGIGRSRS